MKTNFLHIFYFVLLASCVTACGGNKKAVEQNTAENQADITRPPEFIQRGQDNAETDPDETISMEEWQRKQQDRE